MYTYSIKQSHMYKLAQPLSRTMLIHHGDLGEREREKERDVISKGTWMQDTL